MKVLLNFSLLTTVLGHTAHSSFVSIEKVTKTAGCQERRRLQTLSTGGRMLSGCTTDVELTEGPYFIKGEGFRSDIRDGELGADMDLTIEVIDVASCSPLADAVVEIWHANAGGYYSGFTGVSPSTGAQTGECLSSSGRRLLEDDIEVDEKHHPLISPFTIALPEEQARRLQGGAAPPDSSPPGLLPPSGGGGGGGRDVSSQCMTDTKTFFRGFQVTNKEGKATFKTIVPGFYIGRTAHIHLMVLQPSAEQAAAFPSQTGLIVDKGTPRHIGQLFFDDSVIKGVYSSNEELYEHSGKPEYISLSADGIAMAADGGGMIVVTPSNDAYYGVATVYVDTTMATSIATTNMADGSSSSSSTTGGNGDVDGAEIPTGSALLIAGALTLSARF